MNTDTKVVETVAANRNIRDLLDTSIGILYEEWRFMIHQPARVRVATARIRELLDSIDRQTDNLTW